MGQSNPHLPQRSMIYSQDLEGQWNSSLTDRLCNALTQTLRHIPIETSLRLCTLTAQPVSVKELGSRKTKEYLVTRVQVQFPVPAWQAVLPVSPVSGGVKFSSVASTGTRNAHGTQTYTHLKKKKRKQEMCLFKTIVSFQDCRTETGVSSKQPAFQGLRPTCL